MAHECFGDLAATAERFSGMRASNILRHDSDRSSKGATSGMGQTRHFEHAPIASGITREADILRAGRHVSKVPNADFPTKSSAGSQMEH
jgi:hypothetical protein